MTPTHVHSAFDARPRCPLVRRPGPRCSRLARDAHGAVFLEYTVLVAFVGLVLGVMLVTWGPPVVREYSARRAALYSHSP